MAYGIKACSCHPLSGAQPKNALTAVVSTVIEQAICYQDKKSVLGPIMRHICMKMNPRFYVYNRD